MFGQIVEKEVEREELLKTVKEKTKGKGEIIPRQDIKGPISYPKEESNYLETGWDRLELPDNQYDFKERTYCGIIVMLTPYEGSYLTTTGEMS